MTHVLIVEDHEENRNLLKLLLEVNGYRVSAAGDGLAALVAARRDPPDVVVSDVLMPKMDGFALCRVWMQDVRLRSIPFIFYSATYVHPDDEQFALALGAVRYLIKPLEAEAFLAELRTVLQQWAGHVAPGPAAPLAESSVRALHEAALARKLEDKIEQLEQAKRKLQESEARFRGLTEMSSDFYWETDSEHRLTLRTSAGAKKSTISIFERGAQIGERRWDIPYLTPDAAGWAAHRAALDAHRPFRDFELSRLGTDGSERFISISGDPVLDAAGAFLGYRGVGRDITERKRAEHALAASEKKFRDLVETVSDWVWEIDADGAYTYCSPRVRELLGYEPGELIGKSPFDLMPAAEAARVGATFAQLVAARRPLQALENVNLRKDGREVVLETSGVPIFDSDGVFRGYRGIDRDITERKRIERELVESEQRFRGLVEQSLVGIFMADGERVLYNNPRADEILGYAPGELVGQAIETVIAEADRPAVARQIRRLFSGEAQAAKLEFRARRKDGSETLIGAQGLLARVNDQPAIVGVMQDIAEKRRAEEQIQRYVEQLENAFMSTVKVATTLGEMRDPYTAGHQRKVAELAVAIGAELGFDARRQEGLRVAGYLHDIGKIRVPSEILAKPGGLTPTEFQLVQGHAQASYEVLKDVDFPWPIAQIALQHHERIDGSGYPQGLKGEAILLEARILAVADVVEAMSSHRPYRPGLGPEQALAEIERGRGVLYDAAVADACLRLFRERGLRLPD